jgi:alpha,alpha-trehalose phosphorylase
MIKGQRLRVDIDHAATTYSLVKGKQLMIHHDGEEITVSAEAPTASRPNPPAAAEPQPEFSPRESG